MSHELSVRNAVSSEQYIEDGAIDLWTNLALHEDTVRKSRVVEALDYIVDEDTRLVIDPLPETSRWTRLVRAWKGESDPFSVTEIRTVYVSDDVEVPQEVEEMKAHRRWLLSNEASVATAKTPTPKEQSEQARKLIQETERKHNPDLIEAVRALPKPDELLIKFPRRLTTEERRKIRSIARAIVAGKPFTIKATAS